MLILEGSLLYVGSNGEEKIYKKLELVERTTNDLSFWNKEEIQLESKVTAILSKSIPFSMQVKLTRIVILRERKFFCLINARLIL